MADDHPVSVAEDGVIVAIRVTPKAGRQGIEGLIADAAGRAAVKIAVTAVPEDGKANKAVIALLARCWKVPKRAVTIRTGETSRHKVLHITGDGDALKRRIEETARTFRNA